MTKKKLRYLIQEDKKDEDNSDDDNIIINDIINNNINISSIINKTTKFLSLSMVFNKIMQRLLQKSNNIKGKVIESVMYTSGRFSSYTE